MLTQVVGSGMSQKSAVITATASATHNRNRHERTTASKAYTKSSMCQSDYGSAFSI